MKFPPMDRDYSKFRLSLLGSEEYNHLLLLLFWPVYGFLFLYVEKLRPEVEYQPISCSLDYLIPFQEWFVIPYTFWFVFIAGMLLHTLFFDVSSFRKMMVFIMITYMLAILIYLIFPNCQQLRPQTFERDNLLTWFMAKYYVYDTNTNVFPSVHVLGAMAVIFAGWNAKGLKKAGLRTVIVMTGLLIILSTVFLKQHSVLDVVASLGISFATFLPVWKRETEAAARKLKELVKY